MGQNKKILSGQEIADTENLDLENAGIKTCDTENLDIENWDKKDSDIETSDTETANKEILDDLDEEVSDTENLEKVLGNEKIDKTMSDKKGLNKKTLNKKTLNKKGSNKKRWIWAAGICALTAAVIVTGTLVLRKEIKINPILAEGYEVHGVDVSHYQGNIDWDVLSQQNLDFAFIKATEGSTHVDECFQDNWQAAERTHLYLGAYHFFSFDSEGDKQAASYIETVGNLDGKLAPVVDVEYYGNKSSNPPQRAEVIENLGAMLDALEQYYEVKPIIYTTYTVYNDYIKGEFEDYPLWVRSIYCPPSVLFGNKWSFWQYMDTAMLDGYAGAEQYIDVNVFKGTKQELEKLTIQKIMY
ncbi:MAG: hypothetical protein K2K74_06345 [Lachnospiraceae bacterium]|nr:hypothetical protein [Lachnospiraceae bacterium]